MKYIALFFVLMSAAAVGQNELSMNTANNPLTGPTNNTSSYASQQINNNPIQVNTDNNRNVQSQVVDNVPDWGNYVSNVDQNVNENPQIQISTQNRSWSSSSSPSYSSSSSGSKVKKASLAKKISVKIQRFQYKHSGSKKYRHHSGKHSRRQILRCFN